MIPLILEDPRMKIHEYKEHGGWRRLSLSIYNVSVKSQGIWLYHVLCPLAFSSEISNEIPVKNAVEEFVHLILVEISFGICGFF